MHGLLGLGGMIPAYGVVFDSLDAGLYYLEGQYVDAAFSAAAAIPGLGYLANGARGADVASQLYRASLVFDVGANLAESGYYGAQGYATGNRLQLGLSAFGLGVNARAASQLAGDAARAFHSNFEFSFDTASAIAPNTFAGFVRPPLRIQRRTELAPDEVRLLQLQENAARRIVANNEVGTRPSPLQSQLDVDGLNPNHRPQVSFSNGREVSYSSRGSVRPDNYRVGEALEVKNYDLLQPSNRANLYNSIHRQYLQRISNLPKGTHQRIVVDIRNQNVPESILMRVRSNILTITRTPNVTVEFLR